MPALRTLTTWVSPRVGDQRGQQGDRGLGVERPAPLAQQRRLAVERRVRVERQQFPLQVRDLLGARAAASLRGHHRIVRVVVAQVIGGHRANFLGNGWRHASQFRDLLEMGGQEIRQHVGAVDQRGPLPGEVVEPDMVEADRLRRDAEQPGEGALEPDRHVAQPDGPMARVQQRPGHQAHGVGEVDDPGVGGTALPDPFRNLQDQRDGAQRLGQAAGPGRLLADAAALQRPGLVALPGRLAADPQLQQHRARAVQAVVEAGRPAQPGRVAVGPA